MPILIYNVYWMVYNCFLALVALGFGYLSIKSKNTFVKALFGFFWLLFLPNTIYIFTDLDHLVYQWPLVQMPLQSVLLLEYLLLEFVGIITFLIGFIPFERIATKVKFFKQRKILILIIFNFFIAFGMVLGRVERINSWEVFTDPLKVFNSAIHVFLSVDLLGLMILFGLFCNFIYFLFRDRVLYIMRRFFRVLD